MHDLTIVIVAHNAEATIGRAVRSAVAAGGYPILLVADGCSDATVERARGAGGELITVEIIKDNMGVGAARAKALASIETPFGMWLDADDEIEPFRPATMVHALREGADLVYDSGVLIDDVSGQQIKELNIPDFMFEGGSELRCFERNWYPLLHSGFAVKFARKIGFDAGFTCAEDYDFLLRAIAKNANIIPLKTRGYRYFHMPHTISRDLDNTREHVRLGLEKHSVQSIEMLLQQSNLHPAEQNCVLAGSGLYRADYAGTIRYADNVGTDDYGIVTYNLPAWVVANFLKASAHIAEERWLEAHRLLNQYQSAESSADVWNNLGVCQYHLGKESEAQEFFKKALELKPDYVDAKKNFGSRRPTNFTMHPLRRQESRDLYD